jgi:hypothetical protein
MLGLTQQFTAVGATLTSPDVDNCSSLSVRLGTALPDRSGVRNAGDCSVGLCPDGVFPVRPGDN